MQIEAASGVVLLAAALLALWMANSPWREAYDGILHTRFTVEFGAFHLEESIQHLINDGLMAIFFFVVALEIKRELVLGDLRDRRVAALPVLAALGGMLLPALIYTAVNLGDPVTSRGWGIPMATDIAFALGVLSLLGDRVPSAAKLFLLAVAIADDLGAIAVIALFYTGDLDLRFLGLGVVALGTVWLAGQAGIRSHVFYVPAGLVVWYLILESGVHATIAGVALGFLTPARPMYPVREFDRMARMILDTYPATDDTPDDREKADHEARMLAEISRESVAPLVRHEHRLNQWSSFVIIPLFAFANAGISFAELRITEALLTPVALGVAFGLVVGKSLGISLFAWLAVRSKVAVLPASMTWRHVSGVAVISGIGFTVALFITVLAFPDPVPADQAKVGIFAGSLVAGLIGVGILLTDRRMTKPPGTGVAVDRV